MEMPPYCTVSNRRRLTDLPGWLSALPSWLSDRPGWLADLPGLALLTSAVLLVHGFHPWAEDGGLYVSGIVLLLQPTLFPRDRAFVTAPLHYSLFAPAVASVVRFTHLPLSAALLGLYLLTAALLLWAALRVARCCFPSQPTAQWTGVALLAAWWTLPVAGTSLLLMDPYLTARSFSTPLTLLAIGEVLSCSGKLKRPLAATLARCLILLATAAAFHPLMAMDAALFTLTLCLFVRAAPRWSFAVLATACFVIVAVLQAVGAPEMPAVQAAVQSRSYWFLSQWRWFEWLGLFGPLAVLFTISGWARQRSRPASQPAFPQRAQARPATVALCRSSLFVGFLSMAVAVLFVQEHFAEHTAARLQPLRSFLPIYALLPVLLGGTLCSLLPPNKRGVRRILSSAAVLVSAVAMFSAARSTHPQSPHIEWPGRPNPNAWVEAFVWVREHTPDNAVVALDAHYINIPGEDAQGFRALAQRSAVPDFAKDGGEAANFPALAPAWLQGTTATAHLSQLSDPDRTARLADFGVGWLILENTAETTLPCPYRNRAVKVCRR